MAWRLALCAIGVLWLSTAAADASEAATVADRAGFLIGHAQRCGVAEARLERVAAFGKELIAAFSLDDDEKEAAQTQFAERILASGLAKLIGDPLPSCAAVRSQLARLEQHASARGVGQMANDNRSAAKPARSGRGAAAKPPEAARPATTVPEELTTERRAALELRRAAQQQRGRPPSI